MTADPSLEGAHFFLANSYDNLYKPSRAGEAENDAYMQKAIEHYQKAAEKEPEPAVQAARDAVPGRRVRSGKLNDPAKAEPIVKQMIEMEPSEPSTTSRSRRSTRTPAATTRPSSCSRPRRSSRSSPRSTPPSRASTTARASSTRRSRPSNTRRRPGAQEPPGLPPGRHLLLGEGVKDNRLTPAQEKDFVAKGIEATDKALKLNADYVDAMSTRTSCSACRPTPRPTSRSEIAHRPGRRAPQQGAGAGQEEGERPALGGFAAGLGPQASGSGLQVPEKRPSHITCGRPFLLLLEARARSPEPAAALLAPAHAFGDDADLLDARALGRVDDGDDLAVAQRPGRRR